MSDNNDAHIETRRVIADAVEDARDGPLDPERLESIRQLLLTSPQARRHYLEFNDLSQLLASSNISPAIIDMGSEPGAARGGDRSEQSGLLQGSGPNGATVWNARVVHESKSTTTRFFSATRVLGTAAVVVIVLALIIPLKNGERTEPHVIASLEQVNGNVNVTTAGAEARSIESGIKITTGDTIRTQGALSSVVLLFPDGTRLLLVGSTTLTCSDDGQKSVVLHRGTMFASVTPQPANAPMLIATPQDRVQVLGTRFSLEASDEETDVCVNEGLVKLTRLSDGKSVEVPAGQRVVSNVQSELGLQKIPKSPVEWSADFESGLPVGWDTGKFVTDDLPPGSKGAVQAVRLLYRKDVLFQIESTKNWAHGLFTAHKDSHLHFTFRMNKPGWFNIFICTRTNNSDAPAFSSNYLFDDRGWFPSDPGKWSTVSIPLTNFRRLSRGDESIDEVTPFHVLFSSPEGDRGLVIDRMSITRGGPGFVEVQGTE